MKIRKGIALAATVAMTVSLVAGSASAEIAPEDLMVGAFYIGDENEGYTENHMRGISEMAEEYGLDESQIIEKTLVPEDESSYDASVDLADRGCQIIFGTSLGYEDYMIMAAEEFPDIEFCHGTGHQAETCGLSNVHNYFPAIYEARYVTGVAAGMKINEMIENGEITSDEAKIGYVGAYPYAEVISGYTAFFLGARSICPDVTMEVKYTNSWGSIDLEKECAQALIADGCILISQHADTVGAPTACEEAGVYCVGYNVDMAAAVAPNTAIVSSLANWGSYYTYAVGCVLNGEEIDVDWCGGYAEDAVGTTPLNESIAAEGTQEKMDEAVDAIIDGSLHVFDTSTWTVDGETLDSYEENGVEYISDGYFHESEYGSAPAFDIIIDGIDAPVE